MAAEAVDDDLRRVGAVAETAAIAGLAIGGGCKREWILPAEPIPISDVKGERQHVASLPHHLVEIGIRRRAGGAALRGEEFDHHGPVHGCGRGRPRGKSRQHHGEVSDVAERDEASDHGRSPAIGSQLLRSPRHRVTSSRELHAAVTTAHALQRLPASRREERPAVREVRPAARSKHTVFSRCRM